MRPIAPPKLNLDRLPRSDLEALAIFKLWEEMHVAAGECRSAIASVDKQWLVAFLKHAGDRIALRPLDGALLSQARTHVASHNVGSRAA